MRVSQRASLAVLAATTLVALVPASAGARIIEIGQTAQPTPPSCPTNPCQAVSRTTGYQAKVGTQRGLMGAPADGKIVAWSITLGSPGKRQIKYFNDNYGGASLAGISILKPGTRLFHRVLGLTVPSWAPALALGMGNDTSWRASRAKGNCAEPGTQSAQLDIRDLVQYRCLYRTARLAYSATLITTPKPSKKN